MSADGRDETMERLAEQLPRIVFKDNSMEMLLSDDAPSTLPAMRMVAMIEAYRVGGDMEIAKLALREDDVLSMPLSERMTRCIAAFKYIHEWKRRQRADREPLPRRIPGRPRKPPFSR